MNNDEHCKALFNKYIFFIQKYLKNFGRVISVFSYKNRDKHNNKLSYIINMEQEKEVLLKNKRKDFSPHTEDMVNKDNLTPDQTIALKAMMSGRDVFISGGAGVGKTYLLRKFVEKCPDKNILICAPTGVAAYNAGGVTCHSLFGFEVKKNDIYNHDDIHQTYKRLVNYKFDANQDPDKMTYDEKRFHVLFRADVIIIDEISMCRGDLFEMVMAVIEGMGDNISNTSPRP